MALRFVHTADLHLGSPFTGMDETAPDIANRLRESVFRAFEATIDLCVSERVDALIIAGDVLDSSNVNIGPQERFADGLLRLHTAGVPSFVCHGNHDPLDAWTPGLEFPETCHRFGAEIEEVPIDPAMPEKGVVVGISFPSGAVTENLAARFRRGDSTVFTLGLLHCNVGADPDHDAFSPCSVQDLEAGAIDYWALGHIHNRTVLRKRSPAIVYPGIPQGRHPGEPGARGVSLVTVDDRGTIDIEFRPVDVVRWGRTELDISSITSMSALVDSIRVKLERELAAEEGRSLIYSVKLTGGGSLREAIDREGATDELALEVNAVLSLEEPWIWCRRIGLT